MQYILSEEEMEKFRKLEKKLKSLPSVETLQKMCTKIANEWPTFTGWGNHKHDPEPWGCVLTRDDNGEEWYCDECPVQNICPLEWKSWSK